MTEQEKKRVYNQAYYAKKRAEILAQKRDYYEGNKERILAYEKAKYDPEKKKKYNQEYFVRNHDRILEYERSRERPANYNDIRKPYRKQWAAKNKERIRCVNQSWYARLKADPVRYAAWLAQTRRASKIHRQKNPEVHRHYQSSRKERKRNAAGHHTLAQWLARCEYYGNCCAYCHIPLDRKSRRKDHVKALKNKGSNWPANLVPCCGSCNSSKGIKTWQPRLPIKETSQCQ